MPSKRNVQQLTDLKDRVAKAKSVVFTDNSGLNASGQAQLREKLIVAGGEMIIAKNTLLRLALKAENNELMIGPTAVLWLIRMKSCRLKFWPNLPKPMKNQS